MMKKYTVSLAFVLVMIVPGISQMIKKLDGSSIPVTTIDKTIRNLMNMAEVTGLNLAILNDNRVVYLKSYGYKNKEKGEVIDTASCFYAASFAKAVFAYMVMQLVEEKLIDLDKPIYEYLDKPLPEFEDYKDLSGDNQWKLITARHCLSHTTGFPNWRWLNPKGTEKLEIFFRPGSRYAYSGEGLALLQFIIEKITAKKLEDLAQERVFKPLGMYRTSFLWQPAFESNYAIGYNENGDFLKKKKRTEANAAGSMETTIADYSRFIAAVMLGQGLSQKTKREMVSSQIEIRSKRQFPSLNTDSTTENRNIQLSYGLGWGTFKDENGNAFFKEGHDDGWEHYNVNYPDKKMSIIIMTNSSNGESIFQQVVDSIFGKTGIPWEWEGYTPFRSSILLDETILKDYQGVYVMDQVDVIVTLEGKRLKMESEKGQIPKSNLYASKKDQFFLKISSFQIEFVRDGAGKVIKMVAIDGDQRNELIKKQ